MKKQRRKTKETAETPQFPFQVTVGNLGTVYDGPSRKDAAKHYEHYVKQSASPHGGLFRGESVTMLQEGNVEYEHEGWMHLTEEASEELVTKLTEHRKTHPHTCALCNGQVDSEAPTMQKDDDLDIEVKRRCTQCGFEWVEDYVFELLKTTSV